MLHAEDNQLYKRVAEEIARKARGLSQMTYPREIHGGRYWDRTSDFYRVKVALSR